MYVTGRSPGSQLLKVNSELRSQSEGNSRFVEQLGHNTVVQRVRSSAGSRPRLIIVISLADKRGFVDHGLRGIVKLYREALAASISIGLADKIGR